MDSRGTEKGKNPQPPKSVVVDRLVSRAWRDPQFRDVLFEQPREALCAEFGAVPEGFENVKFQRCEVDRAVVRNTAAGKRLVVRPKREDRPLSVVTRQVFGVPELVIVFYTKRCQYQCSFCTLPSTSAHTDVSFDGIKQQLDRSFEQAGTALDGIRQVSLGNEGSILDESTFPREQLAYVLTRCAALPAVEEIVLETRAEYISEEMLDQALAWARPCRLTMKIGLESADQTIRESILGKRMDLARFERAVRLLGTKGVGLASYVLVKANPVHGDEEGREDAIRTCNYLKQLCDRHRVALTLRINSMYRAEGSLWARWAAEQGWQPPSIFDLAEVMLAVRDGRTMVFAGLYDEGLATMDGHYEVRPDFAAWALDALERYNQTNNVELLERVAKHRASAKSSNGADDRVTI